MIGYNANQPMSSPHPNEPVRQRGFTEGYRGDADASEIPLDASPALSDVRFDRYGIRRDWGYGNLGAAMGRSILGIQDHKYILNETLTQRIIRVARNAAGQAIADIWNGSTWTALDDPDEAINDAIVSILSIQGSVVFANGTKMLEIFEAPEEIAGGNNFPSGNVVAEGESTTAVISPAGAVGNRYTINYNVTASGPSVSGITVVVGFLKNDEEFEERTYVSEASDLEEFSESWATESITYEGEVADGDEFSIAVKSVDGTVPGDVEIPLSDTTEAPTICAFGSKASDEEPVDSKYVFKGTIYPKPTFPGDFTPTEMVTFSFYKDSGSGWEFIDIDSVQTPTELEGPQNYTFEVSIPGMLTGDRFGVKASSSSEPECNNNYTGMVVSYASLLVTGEFTATVSGESAAAPEDRLGVSYTRLGDPILTFAPLTDDTNAPDPTFLFAFADRLVALRDEVDTQSVAWSTSGNIKDWTSPGSGQIFLVDTRVDPIDEVMAGAIVGQNVGAIFRRRSISRLFETGRIEQALGVVHWIDYVGTDAPHTVRGVNGGVLFLGHDRMVYYLTQSGVMPVGIPVLDIMKRIPENRLLWTEAEYNPKTGEYFIGVPLGEDKFANEVWVFDLNKFLVEQKMHWRKRAFSANYLRVVSAVESTAESAAQILLVAQGGQVQVVGESYTTYAGTPFTGTWQSRPLNLNDRASIDRLVNLFLDYYSDAEASIKVRYTSDGGATWSADEEVSVNELGSLAWFKPANVTGRDIRFEIVFESAGVRVSGFRAELAEGSIFS